MRTFQQWMKDNNLSEIWNSDEFDDMVAKGDDEAEEEEKKPAPKKTTTTTAVYTPKKKPKPVLAKAKKQKK